MAQTYWLSRKRSSLVMARDAASAEARLIHFQLAGFYSVKAAVSALAAPASARNAGAGL